MSILEILEVHQLNSRHLLCACGDDVSPVDGADWLMDEVYSLHRAHVAQVLEQHEREAKAEALEEAADEIDRLDGGEAEMYNEELNATPVTFWLRNRAAQIRSRS